MSQYKTLILGSIVLLMAAKDIGCLLYARTASEFALCIADTYAAVLQVDKE